MSKSDPFIGYCDDCHAPIARKPAWQLVRDALAFDIWMALPTGWLWNGFGFWLLGFAGSHAHTCICPGKARV